MLLPTSLGGGGGERFYQRSKEARPIRCRMGRARDSCGHVCARWFESSRLSRLSTCEHKQDTGADGGGRGRKGCWAAARAAPRPPGRASGPPAGQKPLFRQHFPEVAPGAHCMVLSRFWALCRDSWDFGWDSGACFCCTSAVVKCQKKNSTPPPGQATPGYARLCQADSMPRQGGVLTRDWSRNIYYGLPMALRRS
jgi:hypothetical protein